ncbi:hypothetical protein LXL04_023020 [Taraxacum kok-saghyz]
MPTLKIPPGPRRLPLIGTLHRLIGKDGVHQTLRNLSETYGPAMLLHFGAQPVLVISSTEMAAEVLKTHDQKMCTRPYSKSTNRLSYNYKDIAFAPHNDHWRDMRKVMVSEFLGAKRMRLYNRVMENEMEDMVRSLSSMSSSRITVNLDDMLFNLVNDVVCKVAFGKTYRENTFNGKTMKEIVDESVVMLGGSFADIFPTFGWIFDRLSGWDRRLEKCVNDFDGFLEMILDDNREGKTNEHGNDFVSDCSDVLNRDEMKALMMNVYEGAFDTTAITIVWAMSEIVKNPRVMRKLQNEIRSYVGKQSKVRESDITKMAYLKMVVKETLRLHPPAGFLIGRECVSHCQIGGYDILPGTQVMVSTVGIGRDPKIWKESPTEFHPERFENIQVEFGGKHFEMIPFGGGRRACPGYNLAVSTAELTIANLLNVFNWETPDGGKNQDLDMREQGNWLIARKTPLCLVPIKHNSQD